MRIVKIEPSRHKKGRILLHTEEGDLLRITERELLRFDLHAGMDLPPELCGELTEAAKKSERRVYAARLASSRLLSEKELREKLIKRDADEDEAAELSAWLAELGALDDTACAEAIVRHYAARGYGRGRVEHELRRRGIAEDLWENALTLLPDPADSIERFLHSKCGDKTPDRPTSRRLAAALQRRGFAWEDIRPVLNRWGQEFEE